MEEELTCSICLELYSTPLMLPCTHNFCEQCVQGLIRHSGTSGRFSCPTCRRDVLIDRGFTNPRNTTLPVNRSLNLVVKAFIKEKERNHFVENLCFQHNEPRDLFCTTCKTDLCKKCLEKDESHLIFGHNVAATEELITDEKRKLNPLIEEAKRLHEDIREKQKQIKTEEDKIKEEAKRKIDIMRANCDIMTSLLYMKKQELEASMQKAVLEDLSPLRHCTNDFKRKEQQLESMLRENKMVRSSGSPQIKLKGLQDLFSKLSSFIAFSGGSLVNEVSLRHQGVEFSQLENAIKSLRWTTGTVKQDKLLTQADLEIEDSNELLLKSNQDEMAHTAQHADNTKKKTASTHKKAPVMKDIIKGMENWHLSSKNSKSKSPRKSAGDGGSNLNFARFTFSSEDIPGEAGLKKVERESSRSKRRERSLAFNFMLPTLANFSSNQTKGTDTAQIPCSFTGGDHNATGASNASTSKAISKPSQERKSRDSRGVSTNSGLVNPTRDSSSRKKQSGKNSENPSTVLGAGAAAAGTTTASFAGDFQGAVSSFDFAGPSCHCKQEQSLVSTGSVLAEGGLQTSSSHTPSNTDSDDEWSFSSVTSKTLEAVGVLNAAAGGNVLSEAENVLNATPGGSLLVGTGNVLNATAGGNVLSEAENVLNATAGGNVLAGTGNVLNATAGGSASTGTASIRNPTQGSSAVSVTASMLTQLPVQSSALVTPERSTDQSMATLSDPFSHTSGQVADSQGSYTLASGSQPDWSSSNLNGASLNSDQNTNHSSSDQIVHSPILLPSGEGQTSSHSNQGASSSEAASSCNSSPVASNSSPASPNLNSAQGENSTIFGTGEFRFTLSPRETFRSQGRVIRKAVRSHKTKKR